jgi:alpha-tubulin suppressor-like RCC1 family protein
VGDGTTKDRLTPVQVKKLITGSVIAIAAGGDQTCALTKAGALKCWGGNYYGEVGDGTKTNRLTPVTITSRIAAVSAGASHTCALTEAGGVKCWGGNWAGQLGNGTTMERLFPVNVNGLNGSVAAVTAGNFHTCALTDTGGVLCWGENLSGQLGDGTRTERLSPVGVHGLSGGAIAIAAGSGHTCALTTAGGVKCWGGNSVGQLGDGTTTDRLTPVNVKGLTSGVIAIAAGEAHTCALTGAGGVKCWGFNEFGQLGNGTTTDQPTPARVMGLTSGVIAISAGLEHTCALAKAGGVECWGDDSHGDLGIGTTIPRDAPVPVPGF